MEKNVWCVVPNYMGRTHWDYALSHIFHPDCRYYHVEESLRPEFLSSNLLWKYNVKSKIRLFTIGCTTFWKGPEMLLKTARILKEYGFDFEWFVSGHFPETLKKVIENTEHTTFSQNNVSFLGVLQVEKLIEELSNSTIYVHTAYIDNSPNSICEAQCLGVPVISTNVGGISSLLQNGKYGMLVPANDPWQMAFSIIKLSSDKKAMSELSTQARLFALKRHDSQNIRNQLSSCYRDIIDNNSIPD